MSKIKRWWFDYETPVEEGSGEIPDRVEYWIREDDLEGSVILSGDDLAAVRDVVEQYHISALGGVRLTCLDQARRALGLEAGCAEPGEWPDEITVSLKSLGNGWAIDTLCKHCRGEGMIRHPYFKNVNCYRRCPRGCEIPGEHEYKVGGTD